MPLTLDYTGTLTVTSCWCGIRCAIPENLYRYANNHKGHAIFCPLGHEFIFTETNEEKLAAERRRHQATRDLLAHEERAHRATRGHLTRQKKRASAGVCPCCNRTFQQLSRHMKSQHPEFVKEAAKA